MLHCVFRCIFWKHVFCSLTCSCITWNRDESSIAWRTYGISSTVCPFFRSAIPDHLVAEVCRVAAFDPGPTSALLGRGETRGDSEVYGICQTSKGCVNQMPIVRFDPIWNIRINYSNSYSMPHSWFVCLHLFVFLFPSFRHVFNGSFIEGSLGEHGNPARAWRSACAFRRPAPQGENGFYHILCAVMWVKQ
jgi:hypothetical protein